MRLILTALGMLLAAGAAQAQQTPTAYCATVPSNMCEILNVDLVSTSTTSAQAQVFAQIKYCKQSRFKLLYVVFSNITSYNGFLLPNKQNNGRAAILDGTPTYVDAYDCATLP